MSSTSNFEKALKKVIKDKSDEVLKKKVAPIIKKKLQKKMAEVDLREKAKVKLRKNGLEVGYKKTFKDRNHELEAENNMRTEVEDNTVTVYSAYEPKSAFGQDITSSNDAIFSQWIEEGDIYLMLPR